MCPQTGRKAAENSGFSLSTMFSCPATGQLSLPVGLAKVAEAEVVVMLVAHRYGWVPDGPYNADAKSNSWLECEHAWQVREVSVSVPR